LITTNLMVNQSLSMPALFSQEREKEVMCMVHITYLTMPVQKH